MALSNLARELYLLENSALKFIVFRKKWISEEINLLEDGGEFNRVYRQILQMPDNYYEYMGMKLETFEYILCLVAPKFESQCISSEKPVSAEEKLVITIRYLKTGSSFGALAFAFGVGHTAIQRIIQETCTAIWEVMHAVYMSPLSVKDFEEVAQKFHVKWNFPNCFGCIDCKHVHLRCPAMSKYKTVAVHAISDADCKLLAIDIKVSEKGEDVSVFRQTSLFAELERGKFQIPLPNKPPKSEECLPYVLVGNQSFPLLPYLMRPYHHRDENPDKDMFNNKLKKANKVTECAFRIIMNTWRILGDVIEINESCVEILLKCIFLLHNVIISQEGLDEKLISETFEIVSSYHHPPLSRANNRATVQAHYVRDCFTNYFKIVDK